MKKKSIILWYCLIFCGIWFSSAHAMTFAVISDTRAAALDNALEFIASEDAEFILLPGDFYYDAQDYYSHFKKYGYTVRPETAPDRQPVYFSLGNHDAPPTGDDTFINAIAPYYPENGPAGAPLGTVFSFDRGNCHFVITNPYWNVPKGGCTAEQLDWLELDLAASNQPFKFVLGHEPAFPFHRHVGDSLDADPEMRDAFWKILSENGVTAYLCGHSHYLSHIVQNGVWQMDAGQVRGSYLCVTLITVEDETVKVRSYKTSGGVPVSERANPEANDLVFESVITPSDGSNNETSTQYLYGAVLDPAGGAAGGGSSGCFINALE